MNRRDAETRKSITEKCWRCLQKLRVESLRLAEACCNLVLELSFCLGGVSVLEPLSDSSGLLCVSAVK